MKIYPDNDAQYLLRKYENLDMTSPWLHKLGLGYRYPSCY